MHPNFDKRPRRHRRPWRGRAWYPSQALWYSCPQILHNGRYVRNQKIIARNASIFVKDKNGRLRDNFRDWYLRFIASIHQRLPERNDRQWSSEPLSWHCLLRHLIIFGTCWSCPEEGWAGKLRFPAHIGPQQSWIYQWFSNPRVT